MEFRGPLRALRAVVGLLVVPLQMALIPILRMFANGASLSGCGSIPDLDLNGTFLGVWFAHTGFGLPLAIYLLRNYIGSLPSSIIESAKIDGADHFTIFWRLVVPLSVPALAAFAIFQFLWVWNDLLVAYVFLGGTRTTGAHLALAESERVARREVAAAHRGGVHRDGAPTRRVLLAPEVLRARAHGRLGEGLSRW